MKKCLLFFIVLITVSVCKGQTAEELTLKGIILENQQKNLMAFSKKAYLIDNDTESYWGYEFADSLLAAVNLNGKNYFEDLSRIYSAYTYIFYGMSYTKTIYAVSRGDNYSLEELTKTIIPFDRNKKIDKQDLSNKELASIYGLINFYKVSRMPGYERMNTVFNEYSEISGNLFRQYPENEAYKVVSLKNKKLYFKTIINLVTDLYVINNQTTDEIIIKKYLEELTAKAKTLDSIPDDYSEVSKLSDKNFYEFISVCAKIQGEMLILLTNEIETLAKQN
jgi:hypothetical protein